MVLTSALGLSLDDFQRRGKVAKAILCSDRDFLLIACELQESIPTKGPVTFRGVRVVPVARWEGRVTVCDAGAYMDYLDNAAKYSGKKRRA